MRDELVTAQRAWESRLLSEVTSQWGTGDLAVHHALAAVDLEAFRNLIDVDQDLYLRRHLARRDYRRVQRARALLRDRNVARLLGSQLVSTLTFGVLGPINEDSGLNMLALQKYAKDNPEFTFKAGVVEGRVIRVKEIEALADYVAGHGNVVMNRGAAERLGIADGDRVEVRSPLSCVAPAGVCQLCYGRNLATGEQIALALDQRRRRALERRELVHAIVDRRARLEMIAGAGHSSNLDEPAAFDSLSPSARCSSGLR